MRPRLRPLLAALSLAACVRTPPLLPPDARRLDAAGPDSFAVAFTTSRGDFDVKIHRDWAPRGSDRLYYLFRAHYYDGVRFYRTVDNFVTQFGLSGDTAVNRTWSDRTFPDDPVARSNVRGTLTFATGGPDTRTTQLFINYKDNSRLDRMGFAVVGQVVAGMAVVDSLYKGYGEGAPRGEGPSQERIAREGNAYLIRDFPKLDYIITARIEREWRHR
jgi:peptidyl-prolyl cis-trans isomerase A (cyclophilin A)